MRLVAFAALLGLAACESNTRTLPVSVVWMDWPAEVGAGDPFRTRLIVYQPCALIRGFVPSPMADAAAVTFAPYFVADKGEINCVDGVVASELLVTWAIDTAGMAPGLPAETARLYEMRGAGADACIACVTLNSAPWVTFGEVIVRPTLPSPSPVRNAGGAVMAQRDSIGCLRIRPAGLPKPGASIVVENPPDTTAWWYGSVRGYIHQPAAPVCGEAQVFHLVSRN
jgi:hypothetical protein